MIKGTQKKAENRRSGMRDAGCGMRDAKKVKR